MFQAVNKSAHIRLTYLTRLSETKTSYHVVTNKDEIDKAVRNKDVVNKDVETEMSKTRLSHAKPSKQRCYEQSCHDVRQRRSSLSEIIITQPRLFVKKKISFLSDIRENYNKSTEPII